VLVTVPFEAMTFVNLDADGAPVETVPLPPEEEPSPPDYWLVATDGTSWIVDQLGDDNGDPISEYDIGPEVASMAVNNGVIMLGRYDGSLVRYVLP